jgi:hypothetical protein
LQIFGNFIHGVTMIVSMGKKYELVPAAPDLYGRVYYFVSNGEIMSPKSYPKFVAELVCASWNGDDSKFYEVAETIANVELRLNRIVGDIENGFPNTAKTMLEDAIAELVALHKD